MIDGCSAAVGFVAHDRAVRRGLGARTAVVRSWSPGGGFGAVSLVNLWRREVDGSGGVPIRGQKGRPEAGKPV